VRAGGCGEWISESAALSGSFEDIERDTSDCLLMKRARLDRRSRYCFFLGFFFSFLIDVPFAILPP
jgi:hypothetical protein